MFRRFHENLLDVTVDDAFHAVFSVLQLKFLIGSSSWEFFSAFILMPFD